ILYVMDYNIIIGEVNIPCFFNKERIKWFLQTFKEISQDELYKELLKERTDNELHEMSEEELIDLILQVLNKMRKKKMKKEVKQIFV
ncbi:MAG: hypothetical protein ACFE9T_15275, partial [Promethearchaeota archaeon]